MEQEVVFKTQAKAEAQQALDIKCHHAHKKDLDYNPKWEATTVMYSALRTRLDGKFAFDICPHQTYPEGTVIEEKDPANYPVVDDGMGGEEEELIVIVDDGE